MNMKVMRKMVMNAASAVTTIFNLCLTWLIFSRVISLCLIKEDGIKNMLDACGSENK